MIKEKFYWVETSGGFCPVYTLFPTPSCPAVLFCHDYKGDSHESNRFFWRLSRALYEKGIGSVRFDYNGFGNSTSDSTEFTIESGLNDTVAVFQKVAGLTDVNTDKLAILGLGMGGRMAAYLLGNTSDLKAGILLNPANTHFKSEQELEELEFGFEGDTAWDEGWEFSKNLFSFDNFGEGANDIVETEAPILIISGYDDEFIFHKTSEFYTQKVPSIKLEEVMDADHFFSSPEAGKEVARLVTNFFGKVLLDIEETPLEEESTPVEEIEASTAPPLAAAIESAETTTPPTVPGSEVVIKEKLPPKAEKEETDTTEEKPEKEKAESEPEKKEAEESQDKKD